SRDPGRTPLDPIGAGLSIVGIGSLVYGIIQAPQNGWTNGRILAAFAIAVVFLLVFGWWELHRAAPMLDLHYFGRRGFTGGSLAISLVFFGMFGSFFLLTQYLQLVHGYTALGAGVRSLPFALTMMMVAPASPRLAERIGTRGTVCTAMAVAGAGMFLFSRAAVTSSYT